MLWRQPPSPILPALRRGGFLVFLSWAAVLLFASPLSAVEPVALKQYPELALPVPNPMEISKLPYGKTYQVTHPQFVLQFFFSGKNVLGVVLKRNTNYPILLRWCFFRNCEPSTYDYKSVIAESYTPPFDQNFFQITFPPQIQHQFQGLEFSAWN